MVDVTVDRLLLDMATQTASTMHDRYQGDIEFLSKAAVVLLPVFAYFGYVSVTDNGKRSISTVSKSQKLRL